MLKGRSGQQLQMFMTPREITSQYQPLEADWEAHEEPSEWGESGYTKSPLNSAGAENYPNDTYRGGRVTGRKDSGGNPTYIRRPTVSEGEFWDSKLEEIEWGAHANASDENLYDSVEAEGVKAPVHLGTGGVHGRLNRPQIVGGHHRIAAANDSRPDDYVPVLHHSDIHHARKSSDPFGGYR